MIDRTKKYWTGDNAEDINEWLGEYTEIDNLDCKPVVCHNCNGDVFELNVDQDEEAIEVKCVNCGVQKILLDGEEIWEDCEPEVGVCSICKGKSYNVRVGFDRRENGDVKWVYIGNRCVNCGTLGSYVDWKINYGPTDEMEKNI